MKVWTFALIVFLFSVVSHAQENQSNDIFLNLDNKIDSLYVFADTYPPSVEDSFQLEKARNLYTAIINELDKDGNYEKLNFEIEMRLGDVYRLGHNLDIKEAWKNSETHLKKAMKLNPSSPGPYYTLGLLYVNSDISLAPTAEKYFIKSINLSPNKQYPFAYQALTFAYYYQGKFNKAVGSIDTFLYYYPEDESAKNIKNIILQKMNK